VKRRAAIPLLESPEPEALVHYGVIKAGLVTYRARFYPLGSKSWEETLLGEFASEAEARAACDAHAAGRR
jgi:hypothetical protein